MKILLKQLFILSIFIGLMSFAYSVEAGGILNFFNSGGTKTKTSTSTQKLTPGKTPSTSPKPKAVAPKTSVLTPEIPDSQIPAGFSRKDLSPYFKKVKISSASASSQVLNPSLIKLSFLSKEKEMINITGWKIKSNLKSIIIPQAVNIYEPSGMTPQEDIILSTGNYVNIYSNKSAINKNLRLNKCIGYLEITYDFNPALSLSCPSLFSRSEIAYLSGDCQSYILSIGACKLPDVSSYNAFPGTDQGNACRIFLNTISHNSCFQKYRSDSNFLSNEWRVWTDWNILDLKHDRLWLFDKQGLLVDEYIY